VAAGVITVRPPGVMWTWPGSSPQTSIRARTLNVAARKAADEDGCSRTGIAFDRGPGLTC
jgi:hypothetical protein